MTAVSKESSAREIIVIARGFLGGHRALPMKEPHYNFGFSGDERGDTPLRGFWAGGGVGLRKREKKGRVPAGAVAATSFINRETQRRRTCATSLKRRFSSGFRKREPLGVPASMAA